MLVGQAAALLLLGILAPAILGETDESANRKVRRHWMGVDADFVRWGNDSI
jgi:hypothetical protein